MRIKVFVHRAVACPENTELRIESKNGGPHVRNTGSSCSLRYQVTRLKVIAAIEHEICAGQQFINVLSRQACAHRINLNVRIQSAKRLRRRFSLGVAHASIRVNHLAVQVGSIHPIVVDHNDVPHTCTRQI